MISFGFVPCGSHLQLKSQSQPVAKLRFCVYIAKGVAMYSVHHGAWFLNSAHPLSDPLQAVVTVGAAAVFAAALVDDGLWVAQGGH